jgi:hypothetical protein
MPEPGNGLAGHDIVIYQPSVAPRHQEKICLEPVHNARVAMEVNSGLAMLEAAASAWAWPNCPATWPMATSGWCASGRRVDHYDVWLVMHAT